MRNKKKNSVVFWCVKFFATPERITYWGSEEDADSAAAETIVRHIDIIKEKRDRKVILTHIAKGKFIEAVMVWCAADKAVVFPTYDINVIEHTINSFDNNRYFELRCKAITQMKAEEEEPPK